MLHIALVVASLSIYYRERACPLPIHFMEVSIVEEFGLDKFFSNPSHDNVKNHSEVKRESQERRALRAPKSFSSSPGWADDNPVNSAEDGKGERKGRDFEVGINRNKSQSEVEEQGISVGSSMDSQHFKTERYYSSVVGEMSAHQGIVLTSLNTSPQDFRVNDSYRAIRTLLERVKSYPLFARREGMEGTVFVSFVIGSRGLPQDVKIMKSSGYQILDEEVKKMLRKASPFPELRGEIIIPIIFKLTDSISNR